MSRRRFGPFIREAVRRYFVAGVVFFAPIAITIWAIGSIIVHGRFKYASLGQLVSDWLGHAGRIEKLSCQYRGMDMPDQPVNCRGVVRRKYEEGGKKKAELEIWTENGKGKKTTPGEAIVSWS